MGRRGRKRGEAVTTPAPARPPAGRAPHDARPRAPWHPFPLVELSVLIGLVLLVWGLVRFEDESGRVLVLCGMALASLAGLDTALREHFGGRRSHAGLLAGVPAVVTAGGLFFARAPWIAVTVAGVAVFAAGFVALRRAFRRRG